MLNYQDTSLILHVNIFQNIFIDISLKKKGIVILNNEELSFDQFLFKLLHSGLDPLNHLFSCDGNQLLYPNPYVETFIKDFRKYYELLGEIFALVNMIWFLF